MALRRGEGGWAPRWLRGGEIGRRDDVELELQDHAAWSARVPRAGLEVRCGSGTVLVTVEGDPEDHVLEAGGVLSVQRRGRLAVWALASARVTVRGRTGGRVRAPARGAGLAVDGGGSRLRSYS